MATVPGGELAARALAAAGVRKAFAIHGGHLETVFQGCVGQGIEVIDVRHEVAAGHAAEGYARSTRGLGVAMATAGPGFTNVVTSIANAYLDRTPVLYLTASAPLAHAEANMVQGGIDQVAIAQPITRWAHQATSPREIPHLLAHAIRVATSAPTGPVLLDLPIDVSFAPVDEDAAPIRRPGALAAPAPRASDVDAALQLLANARRPVILAGAGAYRAGAEAELRSFVEATRIPVFAEYESHGLLPSSHPLYAGTLYKLAEICAAGEPPDAVLALGLRFGVATLGGDRLVPPGAKLIHVEVDAKEIGRLRDADIGMLADSREVLAALDAQARTRAWPDWSSWHETLGKARAARQDRFREALARSAPPIHPYQAARAIMDSVREDAILVGDGAEAHHWLAEVVSRERPGCYFTHGHLGALGFGLGFSIGVQVAHPDRQVLCVTGDGGVGFTIAEFDSMVRHGLPIVVVVMNNHAWGASMHFAEAVSGPGRPIATALGDARYDAVAAGFGCHAAHVTAIEELAPAIRDAFASGRPACINVEIEMAPMPPESELLASYG